MVLIIVHYHLRPGGIRRVIELAAPHIVRESKGQIEAIVLASGEPPDAAWLRTFRTKLGRTPFELFIEPAFKYLSAQRGEHLKIERQLRTALAKLLSGRTRTDAVVWAHNLGIGRNLLLSLELANACSERGLRLVSHHHDWWFDNRWHRWPEMRRYKVRSLAAAAKAIFPAASGVQHIAINRADANLLKPFFHGRATWLPNLAERDKKPTAARVRQAFRWMRAELSESSETASECRSRREEALTLSDTHSNKKLEPPYVGSCNKDPDGPIWLLPCRMLRRKNIAEALLLTRWLRPEAWLVTTGGPSSADEQHYFERLAAAARQHQLPLRLGILQGDETHKPTVAELLAASEVALLTSIQEGFGLPYLEAAAAGRPLIARRIPDVAPDLRQFGFRFPYYYDEIVIEPSLFDWVAERERQTNLFLKWRKRLPRECARICGRPVLVRRHRPGPVPFSRLTLAAQLEVLRQPVGDSWAKCAALNPFLREWKEKATVGGLSPTVWPPIADRWLSGTAYARRFLSAACIHSNEPIFDGVGAQIQRRFLKEKLRAEHLFPLLWEV